MHPPNPEAKRAALAGGLICSLESHSPAEITPTARQVQRIRHLYALSFDAARVVAELAFGVAR